MLARALVRATSVLGGLHHEYALVPMSASVESDDRIRGAARTELGDCIAKTLSFCRMDFCGAQASAIVFRNAFRSMM